MTRARFIDEGTTSGSGGGPGGGDTVLIGPDYGDERELTAGAAVSFAGLDVGPFDLSPTVGVNMSQLNLGPFPGLTAGAAVKLGSMRLGPFAAPKVGAKVTGKLVVPTLYAGKDVFVGASTLCSDDTNHNGEDLSFDGVLVQAREVLIGWDLSQFSARSTVTAAQFTINWKANLLEVLANQVDIHSISNAAETWGESTVTCSTRPASTGIMQSFQWTPSGLGVGVQQTVTLNSTVLARMNTRMGVGWFTMLLRLGSANLLSREAESKDEGTNNHLGPRLRLEMNL